MRALALILLLAASARASDWSDRLKKAQWTPIFDGQALLGQVFLDGKASSWEGNASMQFTPAVKFDESNLFLPTYAAAYQGTKSVTELAGGAQLFQDSQSHTLSLKEVWRRGAWKMKPTLGYRWELMRESSSEDWGSGLFDYRKRAADFEVEHDWSPRAKASAAFDYYAIDFPNYASLESQVSGSLGREQSQTHTLNTRNYSWTLGGEFPLGFDGGALKLTGNITERYYPDQHQVDRTGALTPDLRSDEVSSLAATFFYGRALSPKVSGVFSLSAAYTHDASAQNHYDPELNVFNPTFYAYEERSIEPKITAVIGARKVQASFSYLRIERDYLDRLAQDAAGTYQNELTHLAQDSFLLDLAIPLGRGFTLISHSALTDSGSNMRYEKTFRYNYTISSQLLGFSYSY